MIALTESLESTGQSSSGTDKSIISAMIVMVNAMTVLWPIVRKIATGTFQGYIEKIVWLLSLPLIIYTRCCGSQKNATTTTSMSRPTAYKRQHFIASAGSSSRSLNTVLTGGLTYSNPAVISSSPDGQMLQTTHRPESATLAIPSCSDSSGSKSDDPKSVRSTTNHDQGAAQVKPSISSRAARVHTDAAAPDTCYVVLGKVEHKQSPTHFDLDADQHPRTSADRKVVDAVKFKHFYV